MLGALPEPKLQCSAKNGEHMTQSNEDNPPVKQSGCLFVRGLEHPEAQAYYSHFLADRCPGNCNASRQSPPSPQEVRSDDNKNK